MIDRADETKERPDEWGRDPSVRAMRGVFAAMEAAQKDFIRNLGLSPFDRRLRRWREMTLAAFDASWARAAAAGVELSEEDAGSLYVRCLGKVLSREGMDVPSGIFPESDKMDKILRGVFP
jgi:hypothetical protein